jgi:hypothetical protein
MPNSPILRKGAMVSHPLLSNMVVVMAAAMAVDMAVVDMVAHLPSQDIREADTQITEVRESVLCRLLRYAHFIS